MAKTYSGVRTEVEVQALEPTSGDTPLQHIDEDTMSAVILGALPKSSNEKHRDLANHLVLNAYHLDSCHKMLVKSAKSSAPRST